MSMEALKTWKKYSRFGIDYPDDSDMEPLDMLKTHMLYQIVTDYGNAYHAIIRIMGFPENASTWNSTQRNFADRNLCKQIRILSDIDWFLTSSPLFKSVFDMDGDVIKDKLYDHFSEYFGGLPDGKQLGELIDRIRRN